MITASQIGVVLTDILVYVSPNMQEGLRAGIVAGLTGLYVLGTAVVKYAIHRDVPGGVNNVSKHP